MSLSSTVRVWTEVVVLPTYLPAPPDKNPMFLEKRVYQGSSGKVYPLPFTDRIAEHKSDREWKAVWLENEFLRIMVLPELGGRIHLAQDKSNGFDFIYRQTVIKPALVGLAGPWISGGIEFNWPQHHRPATFMPVEVEVETHADGSQTVWLGDHDPMSRMKGLHGVCLHPGKAYLELKVRVYNRTSMTQTFLWWANVATRVHEAYQSFFPADVNAVADHAKRAISRYPLCQGRYYGVDYATRDAKGIPPAEIPSQFVPPHAGGRAPVNYRPNDLSWYANIPTPCSYMCLGSQGDFFGGYDHFKQAGLVHIANHHIAPGKKQWTWGNHAFGYAWDRNLTDADGPYIELMAGVYTDNQPDFSFLQPGETKTWSQYWYPIQKIGPACEANLEAAISLRVHQGKARLGISTSATYERASIQLWASGKRIIRLTGDLAPGRPLIKEVKLPSGTAETELRLRVDDRAGRQIIAYAPAEREQRSAPLPPTEPPKPQVVPTQEELYLIGLHLEQYRHATRCPTMYWREGLRRDSGDSRCNNAMGLWHLRRGEFAQAESHFRRAITRLTQRNPNPYDGEAYYNLGLCLRYQLDALPADLSPSPLYEQAYAAFYKAAWNFSWQSAAYHALAELDCRRSDWTKALDHLDRSLRLNTDHLRARNLKVIVLRKLGHPAAAKALLGETRSLDPLDWWARYLDGERLACDSQTLLDLAHDFARAGLYAEAIKLLNQSAASQETKQHIPAARLPDQNLGAKPLIHYTLGWLYDRLGNHPSAQGQYHQGALASPDYCFPARLEEIAILEAARKCNPTDGRAPYYLGNLLYDRRRHLEAIKLWELSAKLDPGYAVVWRNLGLGYFNVLHQPDKARRAYDHAFKANPNDARLLYERDQLWKRLRERPAQRLKELERFPELVRRRDDLSIELCALYNQTDQQDQAMEILRARHFQPWEGGEGLVLDQYARTQLALGRKAMSRHDPSGARRHFEAALAPPANLGEARHLLANQSDIHYWLGIVYEALADHQAARRHWHAAATFRGDFQEMRERTFSEMTYYSALSLAKLDLKSQARRLTNDLLAYAQNLHRTPATIDYFATSLPAMLLFNDDLQARQEITALFLQAQACLALGRTAKAQDLLNEVLKRDPNHALAADLMLALPGDYGKRMGRAPKSRKV